MKPTKPIRWLMTSGINAAMKDNKEMQDACFNAIGRFTSGDWGILCQEDKDANDADLANRDGHVLGKYQTPEGDIYINLEFHDDEDTDYACLMFCNEY